MILLILSIITPIIIAKFYGVDDEVKKIAEAIIVLIALFFSGLGAALSVYILYELLFNSTLKYLNGEVWYEDDKTWFGRIVYNKFGSVGARILFVAEILLSIITLITNA